MCGRFVLDTSPNEIAELLDLSEPPPFVRRFNIAPTDEVLTVRISRRTGERAVAFMRWGLVPFWADDPSIASRLINARSETAATRRAFKTPFERRRCVVPASGFYEWKKLDAGGKQPYYIHRRDGGLMTFAGLWDVWRTRETDERIESCTILTTQPSALVAQLHDRMPAILDPHDFNTWLDPETTDRDVLRAMLRPAPEGALSIHPVSRRVNRVANDDPSLIDPVQDANDAEPGLFE